VVEKELLGERRSLTLKRFYPVAPEKVWRAWTDPQALGQWFRPDASFSIPVAQADVRVGGRFRILMVNAKGEEFDLAGTYREVVPGRRLAMTWGWQNRQPGYESLVTVTLRAAAGGTDLELRHDRYVDIENQPTHEQGWNGALDKLGSILAADSIELRILLDAPRTQVWRALTNAEAFGTWFGVDLKGKAFAAGKHTTGRITIKGFEHIVFDALVERIEPERLFTYRWHPYAVDPAVDYSKEPRTLVVFELQEDGEGTLLKVTESGFDNIPVSRRAEAFRMNSGGWQAQLRNIENFTRRS
jgi:uncharacterized protein YndB with AHSA1/START domain